MLSDATVSGRHARLFWEGKQLIVEDLSSANGTYLAGRRIMREAIRPGDELHFGRAPLRWSDPALRGLLRRGGGDTLLAQQVDNRRFVCGACGARGVLPDGWKGGPLRCGSCGEQLATVAKPPKRRRSAPNLWPALVVAAMTMLGAMGVYAYRVLLPEGGDVPAVQIPNEPASGSAEEESIRIHSRASVLAAVDPDNSVTRNTAARLAADFEGQFRIEQVAHIWSTVRGRWHYVNDPSGREYFAHASETLSQEVYFGDCDDFAIVITSMIEAIGGRGRIVMMDGPEGGHAYAEVCVQEDSEAIRDKLARHYRRHSYPNLRGQRVGQAFFRPGVDCPTWLNLDWNAGVPGGPYEPERWAVAIYPDGRTETLTPAGGAATGESSGERSTVASPPN